MPSEITVSSSQFLFRPLSLLQSLLEKEKIASVSAINTAIPSAIYLAELLKQKIKGLYQLNTFCRIPDSSKVKVTILLSYSPIDQSNPACKQPESSLPIQESKEDLPSSQVVESQPDGQANPSSSSVAKTLKNVGVRQKNGFRRFGVSRFRSFRQAGSRVFSKLNRPPGPYNLRRPIPKQEPGREKYARFPLSEKPDRSKNEVFISSNTSQRNAVKIVLLLFKRAKLETVVLKGLGLAAKLAVKIAEEVKSFEPGLHQETRSEKKSFKEKYVPLEEGLDEIVKEKTLDSVEVYLSKSCRDSNHPSYKPPIDESKVKNLSLDEVTKL